MRAAEEQRRMKLNICGPVATIVGTCTILLCKMKISRKTKKSSQVEKLARAAVLVMFLAVFFLSSGGSNSETPNTATATANIMELALPTTQADKENKPAKKAPVRRRALQGTEESSETKKSHHQTFVVPPINAKFEELKEQAKNRNKAQPELQSTNLMKAKRFEEWRAKKNQVTEGNSETEHKIRADRSKAKLEEMIAQKNLESRS